MDIERRPWILPSRPWNPWSVPGIDRQIRDRDHAREPQTRGFDQGTHRREKAAEAGS
jgi:hypothetical protein